MKTNLWIEIETEDFKALTQMLSKIQQLLDNSLETNLQKYEINIDTRAFDVKF